MDYIRVSASYLYNIQLNENLYFLVKSERRNQYQPVGGCYKYFDEASMFLQSIGAIPEKKSNGVDSLMDLRLLVPADCLQEFVDWYQSGLGRETTYDREFNEEVVQDLVDEKNQQLFDDIKATKQKEGSFDIFYDEEKQILTIKPMDIVSINLSDAQKQCLKNACYSNPEKCIIASREEIEQGYKIVGSQKVKIGSHTKNILCEQSQPQSQKI